jgi:hypothetical protein
MHALEIAHGNDGTAQRAGMRRYVESVADGNESRWRRVDWHQ